MTERIPPSVRQAIEWLSRDGQASHVFAASPQVAELIDVAEVAGWLVDSNLRHPQFEVVLGRREQPAADITRARPILGRVESGFPDPVAIAEAIRRGGTVQVNGLETWHAGVRRVCAELQSITRLRVGAVAFLAGPGAPGEYGMPAHRDYAHAVAVQIAGDKRWELLATTDEDSLPTATVTLHPGDALYVPLGCPHRASAGRSGSLHLSITIRPITLTEAMQALTTLAWSLPSASEYIDGTRDERVRQIAGLLDGVATWAQQQVPESVLDALEKRWIAAQDGDVDPFADIVTLIEST